MSDYLEWFENAYFLLTVRIFDASLARSKANPKKIYCVDHALVTSVASGILVNSGNTGSWTPNQLTNCPP